MRNHILAGTMTAALLAGCSGGSSTSPLAPAPAPPAGPGAPTQSEAAIVAVNGLGTPLKDFASYNSSLIAPGTVGQESLHRMASGVRPNATGNVNGSCNNGIEFFAPDKQGDANSTETQFYYDSACSQLARDVIRIVTNTSSSSETVARTESDYAPLNTTPIATRTATESLTNATFGSYGYPVVSDGFDRVDSSVLNIAGSRTVVSSGELVVQPAGTSNATVTSNGFCADSAGFNATGVPSLHETFGWQGISSGGSRVVNADGSITWSSTHAGSAVKGTIGGLSIATGNQNTSCPITTPMFTLAGGTQGGSYTIPVSATYQHGMLATLTVTNATLAGGATLNISTNPNQPPSSNQYITGIVSNGSTQIATLGVNAFGDGTLTVTGTGAQYVITDWHVVK